MIWFTYCLHLALGCCSLQSMSFKEESREAAVISSYMLWNWDSNLTPPHGPHQQSAMFLFNISCLQLCQMFYRGQLCELDFQILEYKQCRRPPPNFPSDLRHWPKLYIDRRKHILDPHSSPSPTGSTIAIAFAEMLKLAVTSQTNIGMHNWGGCLR